MVTSKSYRCEICGALYKNYAGLVLHGLAHTKIDPFQHGEEKFKRAPKSDVYTDTHNDYDTEDK